MLGLKNNHVYCRITFSPQFKGKIVLQTFLKELGQWGGDQRFDNSYEGGGNLGVLDGEKGPVEPQLLSQHVQQSQTESPTVAAPRSCSCTAQSCLSPRSKAHLQHRAPFDQHCPLVSHTRGEVTDVLLDATSSQVLSKHSAEPRIPFPRVLLCPSEVTGNCSRVAFHSRSSAGAEIGAGAEGYIPVTWEMH